MKAEIIAVDLCSPSSGGAASRMAMLAERLSSAGVELVSLTHVRPNERDLEEFINQGLKRSRFVIITGGGRDMAKKTLSRLLDKRLILQGELLKQFEERYTATGETPPPGYEKAALMPHGARAVLAGASGPPGFYMEQKGRHILYLPQLPMDISDALPDELVTHLGTVARPKRWRQAVVLRCYGLDESRVSELLKDMHGRDMAVSVFPVPDGVDVGLTSVSPTLNTARETLKEAAERAAALLGDFCYATGDTGMEETVARLLTDKKLTIALAESCTGGLIAKRLTDVPGSTAYMERGVVSYSNLSKVELLGVSDATLQAHGAVSRETAQEMAEGIRWNAKTDLGLSVTGIAGPTGGTPEKPVGLVYIGMATADGVSIKACNFNGGREEIRYATSQRALDLVRRYLLS
jgi:competence/damage-inducible protein CinA-like protein